MTKFRNALAGLFVLFLFLPYFVLFFQIGSWGKIQVNEYLHVLVRATAHSAASAVISLYLGYWGARGLITFSGKTRKIIETVIIIPNFLPTLFVVLSMLSILNPFPFGFWGIVIAQTILNVGLSSVLLANLLENNLGTIIEHAIVDGASGELIRKTLFKLLFNELVVLFLFIFSVCFTGFQIPLLLGNGGMPWGLEVLIYEKIKVLNSWSEAFSLSVLQSFLIFVFAIFLPAREKKSIEYKPNLTPYNLKPAIIIPLICVLASFSGSFYGVLKGWIQIQELSILKSNLISQSIGTLTLGLTTGVICFVFLSGLLFAFPHIKFQKIIFAYIAPSLVLTGFIFLLIANKSSQGFVFVEIALGLNLIFFPVLYKMKFFDVLQELNSQNEMAKLLGASPLKIFRNITFPQALPSLCFLSAASAFWASGDFALSGIVSGQDFSIALLIRGLVGNYRLEIANVLIWWMLFLGIICYLFFLGINYVFGKKLIS